MIIPEIQILFLDKDKDEQGVIFTAYAAAITNNKTIDDTHIDKYVDALNHHAIVDWDLCRSVISLYSRGLMTDVKDSGIKSRVSSDEFSVTDIIGINNSFIQLVNHATLNQELFKKAYNIFYRHRGVLL